MDKNIKDKGRKKHVTSGGGSVNKRGKASTSGPVGSSSGYSERKKSQKPSQTPSFTQSSGSSGSNLSSLFSSQQSSSGSAKRKPLTFGRIIFYIIIAVVIFFAIKWLLGSMGEGLLPQTSQQNLSETYMQSESGTEVTSNAVLDTSVSYKARAKRTAILGGGRDEITIMVYMCGSDLETQSSLATKDLNEMLAANISDKVNIIVETGGTKRWNNNTISSKYNQRYQVSADGLTTLESNLGKKNMTDPDTLSDFIKYSKKTFPADRYALILWDHGAGSAQGYGYDEFFPGDSMKLGEINEALANAKCVFDFIGFDACLMATFETALVLERYSDYLIASEETEPGIGWYYTDWISELSSNTSMPTISIGKNIIDDFILKCADDNPRDKTTLSIIDLAELKGTVPGAFKAFAETTNIMLQSDEYKSVAEARNGAREFGGAARLDQIDLIHLAQNIGSKEANDLIAALADAIKYNRTSPYITNANGISIYFPYDKLSSVGSVINTYKEIGMDEEYTGCIKSFANLEAGGQIITSGQDSPISSLFGQFTGGGSGLVSNLLGQFIGGGDFSSITGGGENESDWVDTNQLESTTGYYEQNYLDAQSMTPTEKNGGYVLSLTDSEWDLVQSLNLNIFLDDGEGYIDLGLDNVYEFDNDGDLILDYDGTWLAVNEQVVSYYFISEYDTATGYVINGRIPAMLNGQLVDLIVVFDENRPYGEILGARIVYQGETDTVAKGLLEISGGDTLDFLCDFYSYDEVYMASYYLGEQMVVTGPLTISNVSVGDAESKVTYKLTDMYNNTYWTQALSYRGDR